MENLRIRQQQRATRQTGKYILYWMQQAQRSCSNPALSYALEQADKAALPLVVIFVFTDKVPEANLRHYKFMIQGLVETANSLQQKGISMFFALGEPPEVIVSLAAEALEVVADHGYLHFQRNWR